MVKKIRPQIIFIEQLFKASQIKFIKHIFNAKGLSEAGFYHKMVVC